LFRLFCDEADNVAYTNFADPDDGDIKVIDYL